MAIFYAATITLLMLSPLVYMFWHVCQIDITFLTDILRQRALWQALCRSIYLVLGVVGFSCFLAIPSAILLEKTNLPFRKFWYITLTLPLMIPSFAGSFALISAFAPHGSLLANLLNIETLPSIYGFKGAVLGISLFTFPYIFLSSQVALRSMSPNYDEVAMTFGLKNHQLLFRLWLPYLKAPICAGSFLVGLYALSDFGTPTLMRYSCLTQEIYLAYSAYFDRKYASFLSLILVLLVFIILNAQKFYKAASKSLENDRDLRKKPFRIDLGKGKFLALLWCSFVVTISLLIPTGVMIYWLSQGVEQSALGDILTRLSSSLVIALVTGVIIVLVSYPLAYLVERKGGLWLKVENFVCLAASVPGIVTALSLVFLMKFFPASFYQSYAYLILAYLILFFFKSYTLLRSGITKIPSTLEDAARTLGANTFQTFKKIVSPLNHSAMISSYFLVVISTLKELPVTLILAPIGYKSLSAHIWTTTEEAFFSETALSSLLLLLFAGTFLLISFYKKNEKII
ncbi:hypothetical protein AB834_05490 [PVC group bacterium (ex Bugula neritina AB1)]|nr:hypothetical protein AB834_05490 [PVC group bacterium (ex Bugula neritina AB1)]